MNRAACLDRGLWRQAGILVLDGEHVVVADLAQRGTNADQNSASVDGPTVRNTHARRDGSSNGRWSRTPASATSLGDDPVSFRWTWTRPVRAPG